MSVFCPLGSNGTSARRVDWLFAVCAGLPFFLRYVTSLMLSYYHLFFALYHVASHVNQPLFLFFRILLLFCE